MQLLPNGGTQRQGVVYCLQFSDGSEYVGETGRLLGERLKEHKRDIRLGNTASSPAAQHVLDTESTLEGCSILATEGDWRRRRIHEALWIGRRGRLNRDVGWDDVMNFWEESR